MTAHRPSALAAARALAVDRSPVGDTGDDRTTEVCDESARSTAAGGVVVVQHGADLDGSGSDDGETMADLDPTHLLEATVPAVRGTLSAAVQMPAAGGHVVRRRSSAGRA